MKFLKGLVATALIIGILICLLIMANSINEEIMKEYIDSFEKVEIEDQIAPDTVLHFSATGESNISINYYPFNTVFTTDRDFKVMHLTDIHLGGGIFSVEQDKKALNAVAAMITEEKPDLVIVTGDIHSYFVPWSGTLNNSYAHNMFIRLMENLGVYWTVTLGNHDAESYNRYNRSGVADLYENKNLKYCLFERGPSDVYGEGNHIISVKNSQGLVTQSFVMMDTNAYTDEDPLGLGWVYDNIHEDQILWYRNSIEKLNNYNKVILDNLAVKPENIEDFETVQSLLFVHIPILEVRDAVNKYFAESEEVEYLGGKIGESEPYVYSSEVPEEMFETMIELGSTKGMFFGHDHLNNIVLEYQGIKLSYGYSVDYFAYSGIASVGSQRGCTVINCKTDTSFEIIHENYYQDKYQPLYDKEVVDLTN